MLEIDTWEQLGKVAGAILAVLTLVTLVYTKGVRPMIRAGWKTIRRVNAMADDFLGDKPKGVPSMVERMVRVERALNEHIDAHATIDTGPLRKGVNGRSAVGDPQRRATS